MILRNGVDIVRIARLREVNPAILARFIARVYTSAEQVQSIGDYEKLAGLFAAKEAASKTLGTGIGKVAWREIEIIHQPGGAPQIKLYGKAAEIAKASGLSHWSVSISHDGGMAIASVVAIGE